MKDIKHIAITSCYSCPFINGSHEYCVARRATKEREIDEDYMPGGSFSGFPKWCPLPDIADPEFYEKMMKLAESDRHR
jgi:hypothetical protein